MGNKDRDMYFTRYCAPLSIAGHAHVWPSQAIVGMAELLLTAEMEWQDRVFRATTSSYEASRLCLLS